MSTAVCPHCGYNLREREPLTLGELEIDEEGLNFRWKGERVHLSAIERCITTAIARAEGCVVKRHALCDAGGFDDISDPNRQLLVYASKIRARFKKIDPTFDALKTVWGEGYRWAA